MKYNYMIIYCARKFACDKWTTPNNIELMTPMPLTLDYGSTNLRSFIQFNFALISRGQWDFIHTNYNCQKSLQSNLIQYQSVNIIHIDKRCSMTDITGDERKNLKQIECKMTSELATVGKKLPIASQSQWINKHDSFVYTSYYHINNNTINEKSTSNMVNVSLQAKKIELIMRNR